MEKKELRLLKNFIGILFVILFLAVGGHEVNAAEILIGTGKSTSMDYYTGRAICRIINQNAKDFTCKALFTEDSYYNLTNVRSGSIEMGIVESDMQYHAVNHSGSFQFLDISYENIRALFSVHSVLLTVIAQRNSGIKHFDDLKGKRINIGNPGSSQRAIMEMMMATKGWTKTDFLLTEELPAAQHSLALCHGRIQATVDKIVHPSPAVKQLMDFCDAFIVGINDQQIDKLVADTPYYTSAIISEGMYKNNTTPIPTFGMKATVVVSADLDETIAYTIVKTLFDNLERFKKMHPAFAKLTPAQMSKEGLIAPLHEGAMRYYREKGWR